MIVHPPLSDLTQGTIFSCAASEEYSETDNRGLIITARCDVAHGKAPIISYVPLVDYRNWLLRDGVRIVATRTLAAASGSLKSALKDASLTESILETLPLEDILAQLKKDESKIGKNIEKRFSDAMSLRSCALKVISEGDGGSNLLNDQVKIYKGLVQDLLSNAVPDFHYFDRTEQAEVCDGYVALMREIRYLPAPLADQLKDGLDFDQFAALCQDHPRYSDKLCIRDSDQYAMPVGLVQSPYIEFFMQRLTQLFARIGVSDYSRDSLRSLHAIVPINFEDIQ